MIRLTLIVLCALGSICRAGTPVAGLLRDLSAAGAEMPAGWQFHSAVRSTADGAQLPPLGAFESMHRRDNRWSGGGAAWGMHEGKVMVSPAVGRFAVASYTIPAQGAGFYSLKESLLRVGASGRVELRVYVRRQGVSEEQQPSPAVYTSLDPSEIFDFDAFLGYLAADDVVNVAIGPAGESVNDCEVDFTLAREAGTTQAIFPDDPKAWALLRDIPVGSLAGRMTTKPVTEERLPDQLHIAGDRETIALFRAPQSGYYALHDAAASCEGKGIARIYAGRASAALRTIDLSSSNTSLNTDIGYVEKGAAIYVAFAGNEGPVQFQGKVIEWAPRSPPLRVMRGSDGYLDVIEPSDARKIVDIPVNRWIHVPAQSGDATEAIRKAIEEGGSLQDGAYAGIRLTRGATYAVASTMDAGELFVFKDTSRVIFDGNGATLLVSSPELARKGIRLFTTNNSRSIVMADLTVRATSLPFTVGEVIDVGAMQPGGAQTVTFRVTPPNADPLTDIIRNGNASGYCYDPLIPGRLALGTWSHYPGLGEQNLRATEQKGVFTHNVTRTGNSIPTGGKWLVKNKSAGVFYLTTRNKSEDITLWKINARAPGGGLLYFWQTSRINILDCSFEPDGEAWISSSSDAIHGRGREGVWVENTTIRGVCEDILNTYAQTMVVTPDAHPDDNVLNLRLLLRPSGDRKEYTTGRLRGEIVAVDDKLLFFNPKTGHVLGHAIVRDISDDRVTLSTAIPDIDPWEPGDQRSATTVYNTDSAARFYVRDSHFMDSMRFGIFIKAHGGAVFNSTFDGLSGPAILVANEPEWPEGPPATHVWLQGNTFGGNNFGYMSRNRAFMTVDPAEVSIYTRHLRQPNAPTDHTAFLTNAQYANSHVRILDNVFHNWRGNGIAVRNARNISIERNLFLPPAKDDVVRQTLARESMRNGSGGGRFAGVFLDSISGAQVKANRFINFPDGDFGLLCGQQVSGLVDVSNRTGHIEPSTVCVSFDEWFGDTCAASDRLSAVELKGVARAAGRLAGGLRFEHQEARALVRSPIIRQTGIEQLSLALWVKPAVQTPELQVIASYGDQRSGMLIAIDRGQFISGVWNGGSAAWLDLGPAVSDTWQHIGFVYDGSIGQLRGYRDAIEAAVVKSNLPTRLEAAAGPIVLGGATPGIRLPAIEAPTMTPIPFRGMLDELHLGAEPLPATALHVLALRQQPAP